MDATVDRDALVALRRDLHRHPEPAWREFYTTARLVAELESRPIDTLHVGGELLAGDRSGVPSDEELAAWRDRAREAGADEAVLDRLDGGRTGLVAVVERGDGPVVGLRVDIDALPITEASGDDHRPADEGFRSATEGYMHACGHDAHATIGVGVVDAVVESDFAGTLKVVFQPAEEVAGGGGPVAESGHLDDVDALFAVHVGLDHPTGEVVAGVGGFLAVQDFEAEFHGESAHAGGHPERGRHAVGAMATAVGHLHAIPRHADGATRVNVGQVSGGTANNVIPEYARIVGEVRGETTALMEYVDAHAERVLDAAAALHDCTVEVTRGSHAPSAESDPELASLVADAARETSGVTSVLDADDLGGSEDATYLMRRVQERGGLATYVGVGTDHPGGHHTPRFDVDEDSLPVAVELLTRAVLAVAR
ncbi:MAG: amidohydrolase [uncultured archaeon A07HB70]|nr:MAG: amidohydrolase [uncultured archaeon A07HB70]